MDAKSVLDALQEEFIRENNAKKEQEGARVVLLQGGNLKSAGTLFEQDLIIRYFPFSIGRMGNYPTSSGTEPDLLLEDHRPHHLSRLHLTLERRGKEIFLVDRYSHSGSMVDNVLLGEKPGGVKEMSLSLGKHKIRLGGVNSPFSFTLTVMNANETFEINQQVQFDDRTVPVSIFYGRLYQQTQMIFRRFFDDRQKSLEMAYDLIQFILKYPDAIEPLYYFSAVPEIYGNIIVNHSLNVVIYTLKFAQTIPFPLTSENRIRLALAALFHDIGMYDIPQEIINKRDLITAEEYETIKRHPLQGQTWLLEFGKPDELLPTVALNHHERIDGHGYPQGIKDISKYTEAIAIVDFFEALTHYRRQRGPVTPHEGMRRLIDLREAIFSPPLLKQFLKEFSLYPVYSVVRLNTGEIGQVMKSNHNWLLRPIVRILFDRSGQAVSDEITIDLANQCHHYIVKDISDRIFIDHCFKL